MALLIKEVIDGGLLHNALYIWAKVWDWLTPKNPSLMTGY